MNPLVFLGTRPNLRLQERRKRSLTGIGGMCREKFSWRFIGGRGNRGL